MTGLEGKLAIYIWYKGSVGFIPSKIDAGSLKKSHLKLTMTTLKGKLVKAQSNLLNVTV
jgi:hypothetical protein